MDNLIHKPTPNTHIKAHIIATGHYVPQKILTNQDLLQNIDSSDEWISLRTGIKERRIANSTEYCHSLGFKAAQNALINLSDKLNITYEEAKNKIKLIIVATTTPDYFFPSNGSLIGSELNLNIPCLDIQAVCSGFLYALDAALRYVDDYEYILVIGAEKMSGLLDYTDRASCILFGDGAGACVVKKTPLNKHINLGYTKALLQGFNNNFNLLHTKKEPPFYIQIKGPEVYKNAVEKMYNITTDLLNFYNISPQSIDYFLPHQANLRIIEAVVTYLKKDTPNLKLKVLTNLDKYGNTSAASIPIMLNEFLTYTPQDILHNKSIIFTAFGAGFTVAALYGHLFRHN